MVERQKFLGCLWKRWKGINLELRKAGKVIESGTQEIEERMNGH
jgi:hypothetical protein